MFHLGFEASLEAQGFPIQFLVSTTTLVSMVIKEEILSHPRVSPKFHGFVPLFFFENPSPGDRKKNNIWDLGFGLSFSGLLILKFSFLAFQTGWAVFFTRDFIPKIPHQFDQSWGITTYC